MKSSIYNIFYEYSKPSDKQIIYNTVTGSISLASKSVIEKLLNNPQSINENQIIQMKKNGFLVDDEIDEFEALRVRERNKLFNEDDSFMSVIIAPSLRCNYDCIYCFEKNKHNAPVMDKDTEENLVTFIRNQISNRKGFSHLRVTWFGGEPTLQISTIQRISHQLIQMSSEMGFVYSAHIITNGYLLSDDNLDVLMKSHVNSIQITLDGNEETYCKNKRVSPEVYNCVLNNLKSAVKSFKVTLRINTTNNDYSEYYDLLDNLIEKRMINNKTYVDLVDVDNYDEGSIISKSQSWINRLDFFNTYNLKYKGKFKIKDPLEARSTSCGLIRLSNYVVGYDGKIYKCEHHIGQKNLDVGTVTTGYYESSEIYKYSHLIENEKCYKCPLYPLCRGGCSSWNVDYHYDCGQENYLYFVGEVLKQYVTNKGYIM